MIPRRTLVLLSILAACAGTASLQAQADDPARARVEKVSRPIVWEPGQNGVQVPLWPDDLSILKPDYDQPEEVGNGSRLVAGKKWHWASFVTRPTMTFYSAKGEADGSAMLVLPGGGYSAVAMDLEGTEICDWVVEQGMACVLLKYRVPQEWPRNALGIAQAPEVQLALQDAQRAIGLLRHDAAKWRIDPNRIGVIGFSAGAHLAAAISNEEERTYDPVDEADGEPSIPDFAIMLYTGRLWAGGEQKTDLKLAPWVKISAKAPPTLLIHAMDDPTDDVRHALAYALALEEAGVPVDMRLYAGGGHAFGMRPTDDPITTDWPLQARKWLEWRGILHPVAADAAER